MNHLEGKKVVFLGDSITQGSGASCPENCFVSVFGRISGAEAVNLGVGGTRIAKCSAEPSYPEYYALRAERIPADADYIAVFGGTNDYGHGDAPMGRPDDFRDDTFYGALNNLATKLLREHPDARIVFFTPTHRLEENRYVNERGVRNVAGLADYVDAVKLVARKYSIPVLDLYNLSGLTPEVEEIRKIYMPDGLHPSDKGHARIAELVLTFLKHV